MLDRNTIGFFSYLLNSLLRRRPMVLENNGNGKDALVRRILSFVPSHRYLLVTGKTPRWAKFMANQPREIRAEDLTELEKALTRTFEEEQLGRRPVQLIYFAAGEAEYENVLKPFQQGWIATTDRLGQVRELMRQQGPLYEVVGPMGITAIHMGEKPEDVEFEQGLLERALGRHDSFATFVAQMKFTQLHLAGAAMLGEWEERAASMTLVDLEDHFDLDQLGAEKLFELVKADYGLDMRKYFKFAESETAANADKLTRMDHVVAVAVVEEDRVVWMKRVAPTDVNISCLSLKMSRLAQSGYTWEGVGDFRHVWLSSVTRGHAVASRRAGYTYVVLLGQEAKLTLTIGGISEALRNGKSPSGP